jgi:4-aminobutyrate aminotransferase/(S)-3-amino-2-methylpropionate transaminase
MPLAGVAAAKEIMDKVTPGTIGGTYNGNALACASALKVLEIMQRDDYPAKARHIADITMKRFMEWKEKYPVVGDVRGTGAMIGIEFVKDEAKTPNSALVNAIVSAAWGKGLLLESAGTYGNVIRFLAPLCITDEQLVKGLDIFEEAIRENL